MRPFVSCWVLVLAVPGMLVFGCGGSSEDGNGGASGSGGTAGAGASAGGALHVVETTPADAEVDVDTVATVHAVFDDGLQATTVASDAFTLSRGSEAIAGTVSLMGADTVVFAPNNPLALRSWYTATVTMAIESLAGGSLDADYQWMFTTRDGSWAGAEVMDKENPGEAQSPSVAVNAQGTAFAVWRESAGAVSNAWSSRYTPTDGWETPEAIGSGGSFPHVAVDADGNAIATWKLESGIRFDGWVNQYTPIGGWGTPELLETDNAGDADSALVAFDPNGNALAVWVQSDGMRDRIWAKSYVSGAGWDFAATIIDGTQTHNASWPRVAMDPSGNALVVWSQSDGVRSSIWSNRHVPSNGWESAERIEASNVGSARVPQVAFDANGDALAVWAQDVGGGNDIWSNRYTQGNGWGLAVSVHANGAGPSNWPALAMNPSGEAVVVWVQDEGAGFERMWWTRYVPGDGWADADDIGTGSVDALSFYPTVTLDPNGHALTLWVQEGAIWSSRYVWDEGWAIGERITDPGNFKQSIAPQLGIDAGGRATALWVQRAGLSLNMSWNRFE